MEMDWQHVYPVNDKKAHKLEGLDCSCEPRIDWENQIVIHNAWDIREAQEFINGGSHE
jgi:hypothetical protein